MYICVSVMDVLIRDAPLISQVSKPGYAHCMCVCTCVRVCVCVLNSRLNTIQYLLIMLSVCIVVCVPAS